MKITLAKPFVCSAIMAALWLSATGQLPAQPAEAPPAVEVLWQVQATTNDLRAKQSWSGPGYSVTGTGFVYSASFINYHRYQGGTNYTRTDYHAQQTGTGEGAAPHLYDYRTGGWDWTAWVGPLPATALNVASNYTYWQAGSETASLTTNATAQYLTNYWWWPEGGRKASQTDAAGWTERNPPSEGYNGYYETWNNTVNMDTVLELFAGGFPDSTNDVKIQLYVWAYDNLRERYLTWNEFSVNGLTPDTNNNVFVLMQDSQRTNLTFAFSPTNALPTNAVPGSYDYSFWAYPQRPQFFMGVDRNGDGQIELSGTNDVTGSELPYLFWINNDRDFFAYHNSVFTGPAYYEYDDIESTPGDYPDYYYNYIHNERDLEDFTRIHIQVPIPFADTNWGVRISGGNVKLFSGGNGSTAYLTDPAVAAATVGTNGAEYFGSTAAGAVYFPSGRFDASQSLYLLFEGGAVGKFALKAELVSQGAVVGTTRVWLNLLDVKSMHDQWVVGDLENAMPSTDYVPAFAASQAGSIHPDVLAQLTGTNNYVLFVHGWNMLRWQKQAFAETAFKRLWWQGYRGRYGAFRWPTYHMGLANVFSTLINYDCSEYNSWKSAIALENLLVQLNAPDLCEGNVRVMAHSMGNVVTGEALRRLGTNCIPGTDAKYVKAYVAMQGAIPAHCYDRDSHFASFAFGQDSGTPDAYSYYWNYPATNYMANLAGAGRYVNYRNSQDFALVKWVLDQQLKPDGSLSYYFSSNRYPNSGFYRIQNSWIYDLIFPNDTHEIFAFGVEPRCYALGACQSVQGFFGGNQVDLETAPFGFLNTHDFHSKQFRSTVSLQWGFWERTLAEFDF